MRTWKGRPFRPHPTDETTKRDGARKYHRRSAALLQRDLIVKPFILAIPKSVTSNDGTSESNGPNERVLLRELDRWIEGARRPRVVLDCSELDGLGLPEIRLFISCLERVMKRNGDARLAGLSPRAREILSRSGVERLFRIYDSRESAIRSFDTNPNFEMIGRDGFVTVDEMSERE